MKPKITLTLLILLCFSFAKAKNPIGTIKCNHLYIDKYEVTLIDYKEFINFVHKDSSFSKEYAETLELDSTLNNINLACCHKDGLKTPVKGISNYQANEYCKWRSEIVTFTMNYPDLVPRCRKQTCDEPLSFSYIVEQNKKAKKRIVYRIPTKEELLAVEKKIKIRNEHIELLTQNQSAVNRNTQLRCIAEIKQAYLH